MPNQKELLQAVLQFIEERDAVGNRETLNLIEDLLTNYSDVINAPECVIPSKQKLIKQLSQHMADENNTGLMLAGVIEREAWYFKGEATVAVNFLSQVMVLPAIESTRRPVNTHPKTDIIANHANKYGPSCNVTANQIVSDGWALNHSITKTLDELSRQGYMANREAVIKTWVEMDMQFSS